MDTVRALKLFDKRPEVGGIAAAEVRRFIPDGGNPDDKIISYTVRDTSRLFDWSTAGLRMVFRIRKAADGSAYAGGDRIAYTAPGFLFSRLEFKANGKSLVDLTEPGLAGTVDALLSWSRDYAATTATVTGWYRDSGTAAQLASTDHNTGFAARQAISVGDVSIEVLIPLDHLAAFFRDIDRALMGFETQLVLTRANPEAVIIRDAGVDAAAVTLTTAELWLPQLQPTEEVKADILERVAAGDEVSLRFSKEEVRRHKLQSTQETIQLALTGGRPLYMIIGFQDQRVTTSQERSAAIFSAPVVERLKVRVKDQEIPDITYGGDLMRQYYDFLRAHGHISRRDTGPQLDRASWATLYPLRFLPIYGEADMFVSPGDIQVDLQLAGPTDITNLQLVSVVMVEQHATFRPTGQNMIMDVV